MQNFSFMEPILGELAWLLNPDRAKKDRLR